MPKNVVARTFTVPTVAGRWATRAADTTAPSAPTNLQVTPHDVSIDLAWIPGIDPDSGILSTLVQWRVNGTPTWSSATVPYVGVSPNSSSYTITGLTAATPYDIQVISNNNVSIPSAPTGLTVTTTGSNPALAPGSISLSVTQITAGQNTQFGFALVRSGAGASSAAVNADWAFSGFSEGTPSPGNNTASWAAGENGPKSFLVTAGTVTANRTGVLTIVDATAASGLQPTIGSPSQAAITIQNVTTSAKKYRTGHYMGSQNPTWADDHKRPQQLVEHTYLQAAGPNVQGLKRFYYIPAFGDVGSWDFTKIFRDLEIVRAMGKSLMIGIQGANFGSGSDYASILPASIYNSSSYGASPIAGKYGFWTANGQTEISIAWWRLAEMNFVIAFAQAMAIAVNPANGLTLDQDPAVQQISFAELSVGADPGDAAFTATSRVDQYERLMDAIALAFPQTVFQVNNNYAGSQAQSQRLTTYCPVDACALGGPDTYPNTLTWGQAAVLGVAGAGITGGGPPNFTGADQRGIIAMESDTQGPELFQAKYGPYTPISHFDWVDTVLKQGRMVWIALNLGATDPPVPAYPGRGINTGNNPGNWNSCLQVINGNPLTHIALPSSLNTVPTPLLFSEDFKTGYTWGTLPVTSAATARAQMGTNWQNIDWSSGHGSIAVWTPDNSQDCYQIGYVNSDDADIIQHNFLTHSDPNRPTEAWFQWMEDRPTFDFGPSKDVRWMIYQINNGQGGSDPLVDVYAVFAGPAYTGSRRDCVTAGINIQGLGFPQPGGDPNSIVSAPFVLTTGVAHKVEYHIKLNTPGNFDGAADLWVDTVHVLSKSGVKYTPDSWTQGYIDCFRFGMAATNGGHAFIGISNIQRTFFKVARGYIG